MNAMNQCPKCGREYGSDVISCVCGEVLPKGPVSIEARPITKPVTKRVDDNGMGMQQWEPPQYAKPMTVEEARRTMRNYRPFEVSVVIFSEKAKVVLDLTDVNNIQLPIRLPTPDGGTNIAAGLRLAKKMLTNAEISEGYVLLGTDGQANESENNSADPVQDALDVAQELAEQRFKVGAIGISGGTSNYDEKFLRNIASAANLFGEAAAGNMVGTFAKMTRKATEGTRRNNSRALVLVLDASGSMEEGTKWQEVSQVIEMVIRELRAM